MPWTKTDYPDSMKNLDASVRNKESLLEEAKTYVYDKDGICDGG